MSALMDHLAHAIPQAPIKPRLLARPLEAPSEAPARGKFIIFDGQDGCGKGTQIKWTKAALDVLGIEYWQTKQPGGSAYGNELRNILFNTIGTNNINNNALEMLFLSNHLHNCALAAEYLARGTWVIADRWSTSMAPYSAVRGPDPEFAETSLKYANQLPWDKLFLLDGDPEVLLARAQARTGGTAADGGHQTAKKWNNIESARQIRQTFLDLYELDVRTVVVRADRNDPAAIFGEEVLYPILELADACITTVKLQRIAEIALS